MKRRLALLLGVSALVLALAVPAMAARPGFVFPDGCCYYDGDIVRTVVPPASFPGTGTDNFYEVPGQRAVVAAAPGDVDYRGGHWAFHEVSWNVAPYALTSEEAILAAEDAGDVTVTRDASKDFLCPIQR